MHAKPVAAEEARIRIGIVRTRDAFVGMPPLLAMMLL
jgi:hypothetical protein